MKTRLLISMLLMAIVSVASAQEYKVITTVESIIPAGIGRSRMISPIQEVDTDQFTTERTNGKKGGAQGDVRRKDLKIDNFEETKMLNFFSVTGINFQNIASNDAMISGKLTAMAEEGWELAFVTSGVESDSGVDDGQGIYVTRYVFKR
ncbi:MAG: hypothetical protein RIF33_04210 [Cyclobacteriaceae bacterium]